MDSLVDDVLLEAFTYLAERSRQSFSNILAASHVCPRWRKLALACPELWQRFPFLTQLDKPGGPEYDREFTTEILRRCGSLTLDVGWEHYAQECDKGPVTVLREMALSHRLRSYKIAIHTTLYFWAEIHVALARQQAHELQELSIVDHLTSTGWAILPILSIFNNKLPSLQSLSMTRCYVDLEQIQTPHLEELTIETGHITGDSVHLPQSLLGALAAHSNLTRLCIRINTTFTATLSQERVEMTRLVDLDLAGDFPTIQSFFEHVSIPRLQKLKIRFWGPPLPNRSMEECLTECMGKLLPCVPVSSTSLPSTLSHQQNSAPGTWP